jgi:hypothetical protein
VILLSAAGIRWAKELALNSGNKYLHVLKCSHCEVRIIVLHNSAQWTVFRQSICETVCCRLYKLLTCDLNFSGKNLIILLVQAYRILKQTKLLVSLIAMFLCFTQKMSVLEQSVRSVTSLANFLYGRMSVVVLYAGPNISVCYVVYMPGPSTYQLHSHYHYHLLSLLLLLLLPYLLPTCVLVHTVNITYNLCVPKGNSQLLTCSNASPCLQPRL